METHTLRGTRGNCWPGIVWGTSGKRRQHDPMGGEREGACGAVLSRRTVGRVWRLAVLPVDLAGAGWGEIKAADFFANGWNLTEAVRGGRRKCGGWKDFCHGSWVMGGREEEFEPPRCQGRQGTQSGGMEFKGNGRGSGRAGWSIRDPRSTIRDLRSEMFGLGLLFCCARYERHGYGRMGMAVTN